MSESAEEIRKAKEEQYFLKQSQEALKRMRDRESGKPRPSPITGKDMKQITLMGVVIDQCEETGGIWLDSGELQQLIEASKISETKEAGLFTTLLNGLIGKK